MQLRSHPLPWLVRAPGPRLSLQIEEPENPPREAAVFVRLEKSGVRVDTIFPSFRSYILNQAI
jgi:hypothetical protein